MHLHILKGAEGVTNVTDELTPFNYQPSAKTNNYRPFALADGRELRADSFTA